MTLNLSKVEPAVRVEPGYVTLTIKSVRKEVSKNGNDMFTFKLQQIKTLKEYTYYQTYHSPETLSYLKRILLDIVDSNRSLSIDDVEANEFDAQCLEGCIIGGLLDYTSNSKRWLEVVRLVPVC